jgi:hypothetical protein
VKIPRRYGAINGPYRKNARIRYREGSRQSSSSLLVALYIASRCTSPQSDDARMRWPVESLGGGSRRASSHRVSLPRFTFHRRFARDRSSSGSGGIASTARDLSRVPFAGPSARMMEENDACILYLSSATVVRRHTVLIPPGRRSPRDHCPHAHPRLSLVPSSRDRGSQ